jgi:Signal transduction histidine kinase regulating C4-dicarboxylate transport system
MSEQRRILIVDDNQSVFEAFQKILVSAAPDPRLAAMEEALFGNPAAAPTAAFLLTYAAQGMEAVEIVEAEKRAERSFAVAFVDVRMPPGIDGIETVQRLWAVDPDVEIVICSAYSDHSWADMARKLGRPDRWVILKKPFDNIEVLQLAHALTEKWMLRQQTREQVEALEAGVAERTMELKAALEKLKHESTERERFEEERRMIERKLEETQRLEGLGMLAGGVAHDFNNILTGILASATLAGMDVAPESEVGQHLKRIEENSVRAAGLCQQLLVYAGKGQVSAAALDLNVLLRETLQLLHASVPKDADLQLELAPTLPLIAGDAARLRQVFMNLVLNAAEALEAAPRRIRLATRTVNLDEVALKKTAFRGEAKAGHYVMLEIADTGGGMTPDTLSRIFEPFFTTKFTGRGLGLCAVLGIVRGHGGAMHVETEYGRGTTFRVYLPVSGSTESAAPEKPAAAKVKGKGRILVVDDEEAVRLVAAAAIRRQGFESLVASDGTEAVEMVQKDPTELAGVLLDMTMPRMDGLTTLVELRKIQPNLPVVLMSGHDQGDVARKLEGHGNVSMLQKPFTVDELQRCATERFRSA